MSFLNSKNRKERKEENLQELRKERRENVINRGYYIPENNYDDSDNDFDEHDMIRLQLIRHYETKNPKIREFINKGHSLTSTTVGSEGRRLLFSYDSKPIPYIDYDDKDHLINGTLCREKVKKKIFLIN